MRASRRKRAPTEGLLSMDVLLHLCRGVGGRTGDRDGWSCSLRAGVAAERSGRVSLLVGAGRLCSRLRASASLALTRERAARFLVAERVAIIAELEGSRVDYLATKGRSP